MKFNNYLLNENKNIKITYIKQFDDDFLVSYKAKLYGNVESNDRIIYHGVTQLLTGLEKWDIKPKDVQFNNSTLQEYIDNMTNSNNKIKQLILENCKPILKELKGNGRLLKRGSYYNIKDIKEVIPRSDRRPLSSNVVISDAIDNALHKRFGWFPRSEGVFAVYGDIHVDTYGNPYYFFPIGNYKYVWSPIYEDLYLYMAPKDFKLTPRYVAEHLIPNITGRNTEEIMKILKLTPSKKQPWQASQEDIKSLLTVSMEKMIEAVQFITKQFTNKNLVENNTSEVSFKCDKYYLIETIYHDMLMELI